MTARRCARRRSGQAASSRPAGIVGPRPGRGDGCSVFSYAAKVLTFRAGRVRPCSVGRLRCDRTGAGLSRLRVSGLRCRGRDCQCLPSRCRSLSARASLTVGNRVDTCGGGRAATSFTDRAESVTSLARGPLPSVQTLGAARVTRTAIPKGLQILMKMSRSVGAATDGPGRRPGADAGAGDDRRRIHAGPWRDKTAPQCNGDCPGQRRIYRSRLRTGTDGVQ
jgi:hypothetical protein